MDPLPPPPPAPSLELSDIYFTIFRHKWKILLCTLLGLAAAFAFQRLRPPPFESEAKLFIRFVITEGKTMAPGQNDTVKSPDMRGETIINSEVELLTSVDLAQTVVKAVGAEKILARAGGGRDPSAAAILVHNGLTVQAPPKSSVVRLVFSHPDADIVQVVLRELIAAYLQKHLEIHRSVGMVGDSLTQETDQLRARLAQTEEELRKLTNKAGIVSLEDYKKSSGEQMARLKQQIFDVQAELAERSSVFEQLTKSKGTTATTAAANTPATPVPPEEIEAYRVLAARVALLQKREQDALAQFTEESPRVADFRTQLAAAARQKLELEAKYPELARVPVASGTGAPANPAPDYNPVTEAARINALQAKLKVWNSQLEELRQEAAKVDQMEISILELRRRKELEESNYRYFAASLEQSRINEALGTDRVSNISQIETPTPPGRDRSKVNKILGAIAGGGLALGLGWAFAIELFFDRSIRRSIDVERKLHLPLFLSIPKLKGRRRGLSLGYSEQKLLPGPKDAGKEATEHTQAPFAPNGGETLATVGALTPFYETLRDRLIHTFDSLNLRHKPKLVAVTGLGQDSGVTTIAAGLARSFSETGEGNVLLVDMTRGQGSAQQFYKGKPMEIDQLLDPAARENAQVQNNLYVVTESSNSQQLARGMPQRFNQLIPKLKASDFDYIIFDMPPVNQISITPRLANFMDMMLMVVEAEKTDSDLAQHASALLAKSKTPVGVVLNKTKSYIPTGLHQDRESLLGT